MLSTLVSRYNCPWEPVNVHLEDGYIFVIYTIIFCIAFQTIARQVVLIILGPNSPKRGLAPRIGTKLVSVLFDVIAVCGGIKELLAPQESVLLDPIYGFSSHSQFHFSLAAGYFLWAAIVTAVYRGSKVAILHHVTCSMVYLLALAPFMHHVGNIYLLFQASTLLLDSYSCGRLLTSKATTTNKSLVALHPYVFLLTRIVIGLPVSFLFMVDMFSLLYNGTAHSVPVVIFFIAVNLLINSLNFYWGT